MGRVIALAFLLAACASPTGEGVTTDWASNSFVDAASLGEGRWLVSCDNAASACTRRAAQLCPSGFDVADAQTTQGVSGAASAYGGGFGTRRQYQLLVTCRA